MATNKTLLAVLRHAGVIASVFEKIHNRAYDLDHEKYEGFEQRASSDMLDLIEAVGRPRAQELCDVFKNLSNLVLDSGEDAAKQFVKREVK